MPEITLSLDARQFQEFFDDTLRVIAEVLNQVFARTAATIRRAAGDFVEEAVRNSPEYASLLHGELKHELGVVDGAGAMDSVIAAIKESVRVELRTVRVVGGDLDGGLSIGILRSDLRDALSAKGGSYSSKKNFDVPWLEWLLKGGDRILLADFQYIPKPSKYSRTTKGLMVPVRGKGHPWKLSQFTGTEEDNFLTRALTSAGDRLVEIIVEAIKSSF